ncbi:hypothetical protein [Streptomyces sp. URMC 129]|uniref:hypothetical protein n=1 Tax=Streptomyces sp. URMC 129 TaxID=3423407 RepID=UPI003F1960CD
MSAWTEPDNGDPHISYDDPDEGPHRADWAPPLVYAPYGNINTGTVHGGQCAENTDAHVGFTDRRVVAHEGPISAAEIARARRGFVAPACYPKALEELDTGVLFLTGARESGVRTTALNLLYGHSRDSAVLRAVDNDVDLGFWRPTHAETRGYLVDGLRPQHPLKPAMILSLRRLLKEAGARMVILLPDDPELARSLERDLHVDPVRCEAPSPRAVFDARLVAEVPEAVDRERVLGRLDPDLLSEVLVPELGPAQVAELVTAITGSGGGGADSVDIRSRLSFLAEGEVPALLKDLHDDPDGLAFLLSACVFEGRDHRVVMEQAERLLTRAQGRLHSVLPVTGNCTSVEDADQRPEQQRPNPQFVFRRPLQDLLRAVRAQCAPKESRMGSAYNYMVSPVRFTRHGQAEAVLRYVWRQYGDLSGLLADWMGDVAYEKELTQPVGRVMGVAASWGGGRRALWHITTLAKSDHRSRRTIAAYALGTAAEDPALASQIKYRLREWSSAQSWQLRSTVGYACGADFGLSRPDLAMRLLRRLPRSPDQEQENVVRSAARTALRDLFLSGNQSAVLRRLAEWTGSRGYEGQLAVEAFPHLLRGSAWFHQELLNGGQSARQITDLVRRALDDDDTFERTCEYLLRWCGMAVWSEQQRTAVEALLGTLAQEKRHGVLRLFVVLDRHENTELAGRHIAHHTLATWRIGGDSIRHHCCRAPYMPGRTW